MGKCLKPTFCQTLEMLFARELNAGLFFRAPGKKIGCGCKAVRMESQEQKTAVPIQRLIDLEYAELNPDFLKTKVKGVRRRHHCNPMKASLMEELRVTDWTECFRDPGLPLTVDVGSGQGRFAMLLAKKNAGIANYLGLDVRKMLIEKCNVWAEELNLSNMCFMTANATVSFSSLLSTYSGKLELVCILCPDPHFKKRHHKRRVVQPALVESIIKHTALGGKIFLQSDIEEVALDMRSQFEEHLGTNITRAHDSSEMDEEGWLLDNPLGVKTEREIAVLAQGGKMYRIMYQKS